MQNAIYYKSNNLIEASYTLTLQEQRLVLAALAKLDQRKEIPSSVVVTVQDFLECYPEVDPKSAARELAKAADRLFSRNIVLRDDDEVIDQLRWVYKTTRYKRGESRVELFFTEDIKSYLSQLKNRFTKIKLHNIQRLRSAYSIRLYELLSQYKGERMISIEELRFSLDVKDKYPAFKDLNKYIIKPCVKELQTHSNLDIDVLILKNGRSVDKILFRYKERAQGALDLA